MESPGDPAEKQDGREFLVEVRRLFRPILARHRIPSEDGEDLIQQVLVAFLVKRPQIREPRAWLAVTLRNRCYSYWRSHRSRTVLAVEDGLLEDLAGALPPEQERADLRRDLGRIARTLSPRHRELLRLRYGLGYETEEIARVLSYTPSSVRKLARRSLGYMERNLKSCSMKDEKS